MNDLLKLSSKHIKTTVYSQSEKSKTLVCTYYVEVRGI